MKDRIRLRTRLLLSAALAAGACGGSAGPGSLRIDVTGGPGEPACVSGYATTLDGQVLEYHSSHPDADSALLVRANAEAPAITWETDPLPASAGGDAYHLIWLAGLEREGWPGDAVHRFDLSVNGDRWFTFQNRKDAAARNWKLTAKNGAELWFEATTVDRAGDLFGYMHMRVPKGLARAGSPLILRVTGQDEGSLDWYMTFRYPLRATPRLRPEPVLARDGGRLQQLLRLSLDNLQEGRTIEIRGGGVVPVRQPLGLGSNISYLRIPAVETDREIPVVFSAGGAAVEHSSVSIRPVRKREIYLLSYSHNDIGYSDVQPAVEKKQWGNLDEALQIIRRTKDYPRDARYRWNLEVMWPLESYMRQASESRRLEVIQAVKDGSLGLNALYANVLTGLAGAAEMDHFTDYAREFGRQHGVPVTTALVSDVPGFTWGIVPALARGGVRYFASAPNPGDRIGHILEVWGDKPFYWASQSGQERVLLWVAGASYASFHEGDLTRLGDEKLLKIVRRLDDGGYPYDILQLPYTIGGDNGPPDPNLPEFVRSWNERFASPRLIIATHAQMFEEFEKRYGAGLATLRGDLTPYWEDGAASTAAETAMNRRAVDRLIQAEALWGIRNPGAFPAREFRDAWRNVVLWDEHTWGAHNSVSDPDLAFVKDQWFFKRQFALEADRMSRALFSRLSAPELPEPGAGITLDVYNTGSWPRTDLLLLTPRLSAAGDRVVDAQGNALRSQRLSTGELAVLIENLAPLSARRIVVKPGMSDPRGLCRVSGARLENSLLAVTVDGNNGGISSLRWGPGAAEMADRGKGALDQYLYVLGKDPQQARGLSRVRIRAKEAGGLKLEAWGTATVRIEKGPDRRQPVAGR